MLHSRRSAKYRSLVFETISLFIIAEHLGPLGRKYVYESCQQIQIRHIACEHRNSAKDVHLLNHSCCCKVYRGHLEVVLQVSVGI